MVDTMKKTTIFNMDFTFKEFLDNRNIRESTKSNYEYTSENIAKSFEKHH